MTRTLLARLFAASLARLFAASLARLFAASLARPSPPVPLLREPGVRPGLRGGAGRHRARTTRLPDRPARGRRARLRDRAVHGQRPHPAPLRPHAALEPPFLTVPDVATGNEQGLLGLAFDPDYADERLLLRRLHRRERRHAHRALPGLRRRPEPGRRGQRHARAGNRPAPGQPQRRLDRLRARRRLPLRGHRRRRQRQTTADPGHTTGTGNAQDTHRQPAGQDPADRRLRRTTSPPTPSATTRFPPTTPSSASPATTRSGPTGCATRTAPASTARPATSTSATWARAPARRWTSSPRRAPAARTTAGGCARARSRRPRAGSAARRPPARSTRSSTTPTPSSQTCRFSGSGSPFLGIAVTGRLRLPRPGPGARRPLLLRATTAPAGSGRSPGTARTRARSTAPTTRDLVDLGDDPAFAPDVGTIAIDLVVRRGRRRQPLRARPVRRGGVPGSRARGRPAGGDRRREPAGALARAAQSTPPGSAC